MDPLLHALQELLGPAAAGGTTSVGLLLLVQYLLGRRRAARWEEWERNGGPPPGAEKRKRGSNGNGNGTVVCPAAPAADRIATSYEKLASAMVDLAHHVGGLADVQIEQYRLDRHAHKSKGIDVEGFPTVDELLRRQRRNS